MPEYIGNIEIPEPGTSGVFPIVPDWGFGRARRPDVVVHRFGSANAKIEQRYYRGPGATSYIVHRAGLGLAEMGDLKTFWEARKGPYQAFTYNAPSDDGETTSPVTVRFANEPLSWEAVADDLMTCGVTLIEVPSSVPAYTVAATLQRFADSGLGTAFAAQAQELVPLITITALDSEYPVVRLSDRKCTVGDDLYQARLLDWRGISQAQNGESDEAQFEFGNADRVMLQLANDVDLYRATIEFDVYHVQTQKLVKLWKGTVTEWVTEERVRFVLTASDALYPVTQLWPIRTIDRRCWKEFDNAGNGCPFASEGALDLVHFPSADAEACDKGYDTDNGCLAHGMKRRFGGVFANPQGARIKDNSTGRWGIGRKSFTATSAIADSAYGQVLQKVYTDQRVPVPCKVISGRDESDFYNALGVVGEGPIGGFFNPQQVDGRYVGPTLDGQPHHGYGSKPTKIERYVAVPIPPHLGLRTNTGNDPADSDSPFSLGISGDQTGGDWRKVYLGASTYDDNYAAGLAFMDLRRNDEKGLQLGKVDGHEMVAVVDNGLGGWRWDDGTTESRVWQSSLTNPIWILVNGWLEMQGLQQASAAAQCATFDLASALDAAIICATPVDAIIGGGTETQFKFNGIIAEQKPFVDWAREILANCLGMFWWRAGKLAFAIRVNSSTVEAYTEGNILLDSLRLRSIQPRFNRLEAQFANREFDGQNDVVSLIDEDHQKRIGRVLASTLNLAGTTTKSQAARIITTRLREELGGLGATEQRKARTVAFKTTILGLNTEPGMVCSMTHADMPGGSGEFRVARWTLNSDWSIDIEGQTTTDAMYDLAIGPKPADVQPDRLPVEYQAQPRGQRWHPNAVPWQSGDPFFPNTEGTFTFLPRYEPMGSGAKVMLAISGALPVNRFKTDAQAPFLRTITVASTGGTLDGDRTLYVAVACYDGSGEFAPPSNVVAVAIPPGTNTNKVDLAEIEWPAGTWTGYLVYAGWTPQAITAQAQTDATPPSSFAITYLPFLSTYNLPNPLHHKTVVKAKRVRWPGRVWGKITATGASKMTVGAFAGKGYDLDGEIVSVLGDAEGAGPFLWNYTVTAYNDTTGEMTLNPDPALHPQERATVGDMLVVRAKATTYSETTIGNSGMAWEEDTEQGYMVRIVAGTGRGQVRRIAQHTDTVITVDAPWSVTPDATSLFVVEMASWEYETSSTPTQNGDQYLNQRLTLPLDNWSDTFIIAVGVLVDRDGYESYEEISPFREAYLTGIRGPVSEPQPAPLGDVGVNIMSTGVDASGDPLAVGSVDPHWTVAASADPLYPGPDAYVVNPVPVYPSFHPIANQPDGMWINYKSTVAHDPAGTYEYVQQFTLPPDVAAATVRVEGRIACDDWCTILVNGVEYTPMTMASATANWQTLHPFVLDHGFVAGVNEIRVKVRNVVWPFQPTILMVLIDKAIARASLTAPSDLTLTVSDIDGQHYQITADWGAATPVSLVEKYVIEVCTFSDSGATAELPPGWKFWTWRLGSEVSITAGELWDKDPGAVTYLRARMKAVGYDGLESEWIYSNIETIPQADAGGIAPSQLDVGAAGQILAMEPGGTAWAPTDLEAGLNTSITHEVVDGVARFEFNAKAYMVFSWAIDPELDTTLDQASPIVVVVPSGCKLALRKSMAGLKTAPTGAAAILDIQRSTNQGAAWSSIYDATKLVIADGEKAGSQDMFIAPEIFLSSGDWLSLTVTQKGSGVAGGNGAGVSLLTEIVEE